MLREGRTQAMGGNRLLEADHANLLQGLGDRIGWIEGGRKILAVNQAVIIGVWIIRITTI